RCDCQSQLQDAMRAIADNGSGVILYLRQEGRGIGLKNKLRAYALQDQGMDTVEANEALGFAGDLRDFTPAVQMLKALDIKSVQLMTNSRDKIQALVDAGFMVTRIPSLACVRAESAGYLETKADKMGHLIPPEIFETLKKTRA
ncbi:MAG TPA: GTP cyclohydrolase II RibA, partial [Alphaproteobacteria bacterium]